MWLSWGSNSSACCNDRAKAGCGEQGHGDLLKGIAASCLLLHTVRPRCPCTELDTETAAPRREQLHPLFWRVSPEMCKTQLPVGKPSVSSCLPCLGCDAGTQLLLVSHPGWHVGFLFSQRKVHFGEGSG